MSLNPNIDTDNDIGLHPYFLCAILTLPEALMPIVYNLIARVKKNVLGGVM